MRRSAIGTADFWLYDAGVTVAAVIGHQGGWDEILLVAGPIALIAALLWVADKRSRRLADARLTEAGPESGSESSSHPPGTS